MLRGNNIFTVIFRHAKQGLKLSQMSPPLSRISGEIKNLQPVAIDPAANFRSQTPNHCSHALLHLTTQVSVYLGWPWIREEVTIGTLEKSVFHFLAKKIGFNSIMRSLILIWFAKLKSSNEVFYLDFGPRCHFSPSGCPLVIENVNMNNSKGYTVVGRVSEAPLQINSMVTGYLSCS